MNKAMYKFAALLLVGSASLYASSAMAGADTFNRGKLGGTWVSTAGKLSISNDQMVGQTLSDGYQATSTGNSAVSAVVFAGGTDLEYGAVTLGSTATGSNAFVKIQSQDGAGTFDHAAFYTGNNGGGDFFTLTSPVSSPAILDVSFCGTVATMRITSASGVQTYSYNYGTTYTGAGAGTYGAVELDNFVGYAAPSCTAATASRAGAIAVHGSNAVDKSRPQ